jgi:predicted nucleic acid-binding protein
MTWLLDTNVISEIRKGPSCDPNVALWYDTVAAHDLHLSVLVLGEVRKGVERLRPREPARAQALQRWLEDVAAAFAIRILPIGREVAECWGVMATIRTFPVIDGLLAATAKVHGLVLVTRNARDVAGLGAEVLDPFAMS